MREKNEKKISKVAFIFSLILHALLISAADFNFDKNMKNRSNEDFSVIIQIEEPLLLPKIDALSEKKKLKEVLEEQETISVDDKREPGIIQAEMAEDVAACDDGALEMPLEGLLPLEESKEDGREKEGDAQDLEKIEVSDPDQETVLRYQDMIKQRIEAKRRYPRWAYRNNLQGTVYLSFELLSDGSIKNLRIIEPSGYRILDKEALCTVKRAVPFPLFPDDIKVSTLSMEVAIVFKVNIN